MSGFPVLDLGFAFKNIACHIIFIYGIGTEVKVMTKLSCQNKSNLFHVLYDDSDIYMLFNSDTRSYILNIYKMYSINVF